jgi:Xaa-Pro aminopeptidase
MMDRIRKACEITDKIFDRLIKNFKTFKTEIDLEKFLIDEAKKRGCVLAFNPVIAIGKNAAEIHHKPNKTKLKHGFLVLDIGVKYKGYCSDMTRTIFLGKPSKKEKRLYALVLNAQLTALKEVKPDVYASDIDAIARAVLEDYLENFIHGLGHGVGMKIHKKPYLNPNSKEILKKNQIITIEPGLYFKNKLGIRIEDTLVVRNNPIILTKTTKKLIEI